MEDRLPQKPREERAIWLTALILLGVSLAIRLPSYDGRPLWADEMWRALVALDPGYLHHYFFAADDQSAITAPIYAFLIKLVSLFYVSPQTLRLSSLLPGVAAPLLAFAVIRRAGGSMELSALGALLFAFNTSFISYSGELKPYVFEICVHLAAIYVWLRIIKEPAPTPRTWMLLFAALAIAVLSTANAIFLLPSFGISLGLARFARRDVRGLGICLAGFLLLGAMVVGLYMVSWRPGDNQSMIAYWTPGFAPAGGNYPAFLGAQFVAMWSMAFDVPLHIPGRAAIGPAALGAALVLAIANGAVRRAPLSNILLFYAVLVMTLVLMNGMRLWPLGALRPNLFLLGHMILFLFLVSAQVPWSRVAARIVLALGFLALLGWIAYAVSDRAYFQAIDRRLHEIGPPLEQNDLVLEDFSSSGPVGKIIAADCARNRKTKLIVDEFMSPAIIYYTKFDSLHRDSAALLAGPCVERIFYGEAALEPDATFALFAGSLSTSPGVWTLYSHLGPDELRVLKQIGGKVGTISHARGFVRAGYFYVGHP